MLHRHATRIWILRHKTLTMLIALFRKNNTAWGDTFAESFFLNIACSSTLVLKIWFTSRRYPLISDEHLYSHHLSTRQCIDIVGRNFGSICLLLTRGSFWYAFEFVSKIQCFRVWLLQLKYKELQESVLLVVTTDICQLKYIITQ